MTGLLFTSFSESIFSLSGILLLFQVGSLSHIQSKKTILMGKAHAECCQPVQLTSLRGHYLIVSANHISCEPAQVSIIDCS